LVFVVILLITVFTDPAHAYIGPGGGLVNLDMYTRACELPDTDLVIILGEGNFHQIHRGVATNVSEPENLMRWKEWEEQYFKIRGKPYTLPGKRPEYIGHIPRQALKWILYSAETAIEKRGGVSKLESVADSE